MRSVLRIVWAGAWAALAACGSTQGSTNAGSDASNNGNVESGASSSGSGLGSSGGSSGSSGSAGSSGSGGTSSGTSGGGSSSGGGDSGITDAGTGTKGDAGSSQCKRGIASNAAPGAAFSPSSTQPGVSWWYNWAVTGTGQGAGIEFVPMMWGTSSLHATLPSGSHWVLGFNEPNFKAQSNLTAAQAATDWPSVETAAKAAGALIVSPAVNFCGSSTNTSGCSDPTVTDPYTWLKDFFNDCTGCQVDAIAIHWYNCDLPSLKAYIEGNVDAGGGLQGFVQFGKPIWLTEFSCGGSSTVAQQKTYMQAAVPYLEGNPHVARYAWFSAGPIPNAELQNSNGTLTNLGMTYVSLAQSCH
jgi:hypothetical protein